MPTTTHFLWNQPTVGADLDSWGDELNAQSEAIDAEMFKKADKANPIFTGSISAPVFIGTPSAILRPTIDGANAIQFQNSVGGVVVVADTVSNTVSFAGPIVSAVYVGNPSVLIKAAVNAADAIQFQNAAGAIMAQINTLNGTVSAANIIANSGSYSPLFIGLNNIQLRPSADASNAIQFQRANGSVLGSMDTTNNVFTLNGNIQTSRYMGNPTVILHPTVNAAQAIQFWNDAGVVVGSFDTVNKRMAIGPAAATVGAQLELQATDQGLLLNRMTTAQRTAFPAFAGTLVFDSTLNRLCILTGLGWHVVTSVAG